MENGRKTDFWLFVLSLVGVFVSIFMGWTIGIFFKIGLVTVAIEHVAFGGPILLLILIFVSALIFPSIHDAVEEFAAMKIRQPSLLVTDDGIVRLGRGIKRDVFVAWNNIAKVEQHPLHQETLKVWIEAPEEAWRTNSLFLKSLHWVLKKMSLVFYKNRIEVGFICIPAWKLNLNDAQLKRLISDGRELAADCEWHPQFDWKTTSFETLSWHVNLIYLVPFLGILAGALFGPNPPLRAVAETVVEPSYEPIIKLMMVMAVGGLLLSSAVGFGRACKKVWTMFSRKRKFRYKNKFVFLTCIFVLTYANYLDRPYHAERRGFASYEEMKEAKKQGFRTGEKWRQHLETQ
jgi:hypothetical protein